MKPYWLLILTCWCSATWAATIDNIRIWPAPDNTRLVFDVSAAVTFEKITLTNPDRLVIDIDASVLSTSVAKLDFTNSPIRSIRSSQRSNNKLRLVLDLVYQANHKIFTLAPNASYGHRLVVDLSNYKATPVKPTKGAVIKPSQPQTKTLSSLDLLDSQRDIVIAIDAGHGGEDPGALGPRFGGKKLQEKRVVLSIAKHLEALLKKEPGFESLLTRTGDYYIRLKNRTKKAREAKADLFISIHADAFTNPRAQGASVWVLSTRGASSELGRFLEKSENSTDSAGSYIGSINLNDKSPDVVETLVHMSMGYSQITGRGVAEEVLSNIGKIAKLHKKQVEKAGFVVLKSPDVPSILVETGFISNPSEAAKLRTVGYQKQMARAIFKGLKSYFYSHPIANTYIAAVVEAKRKLRYHKVVSGDTLSGIAQRYSTSVKHLQNANKMTNKSILLVGKTLIIPAG